MLPLLLLLPTAFAGEFMDVWVTTAFEDTNVLAGPDAYSPSINFVERGNSTFFENYDSRTTDDLSRANLVLYRKDEGNFNNWWTEAAFVLRYQPYLDPDETDPGTSLEDDGSYVRVVRNLPGDDHTFSITGYAVDSGRWRLGYSYDLTWGGPELYAFTAGAAPGVRVQWQRGGSYAFGGAKTAVGDYVDPETLLKRNQAYYGLLAGAGTEIGGTIKLDFGAGSFEQGQILNVSDTTSVLYGEPITAAGLCAQAAWRSRTDLEFIESADLSLYRNEPDVFVETYISHTQLDGTGVLVQAEVNYLMHNLLDPDQDASTVIEAGTSADVQTLVVAGATTVGVDFVYKDLATILFNVPGLTSGVAMSPTLDYTPQLYGRFSVSRFLPHIHTTPTFGVGLMKPATYETSAGTFVQYTESDKEQVPDGQTPAAILSGLAGLQVDLSKSVVGVGEVLYTVDNNLSDFVQTEANPSGERVASASNERNQVGVNIMLRARF